MRNIGQGVVSARWSGWGDWRPSRLVSVERCGMSRVLASEGGMYVQAMEALHLEVKVRRSKPLPANALSQAVVCGRVATVLTSVAVGSTGRT